MNQHPAAISEPARPGEAVPEVSAHAALVEQRERTWLRRLVRRRFEGRPPVQHDFGCGSGRAIVALRGGVARAYGYDASPSAIGQARARGLPAELVVMTPDGPPPQPVGGPASPSRPAVVTVFGHADDPRDRARAVAFAAAILPDADSGLLVMEVQLRQAWLRQLVRLRYGRRAAARNRLMSRREVAELLTEHGFTIESVHGFALLPKGLIDRGRWRMLARRLDAWAIRRRFLTRFCRCVIYVARRGG